MPLHMVPSCQTVNERNCSGSEKKTREPWPRFNALPASYNDGRVQDKLGFSLPTGVQYELMFLQLSSRLWLGGVVEIGIQPAISNSVDLVDQSGLYGSVQYLWSIVPAAGLSLQYQLADKLRLGAVVLGGYDLSMLKVSWYEKSIPTNSTGGYDIDLLMNTKIDSIQQQLGGGFAFISGLTADYQFKLSNSFSLLLGVDLLWRFGITDKFTQNAPNIGVKLGGTFL